MDNVLRLYQSLLPFDLIELNACTDALDAAGVDYDDFTSHINEYMRNNDFNANTIDITGLAYAYILDLVELELYPCDINDYVFLHSDCHNSCYGINYYKYDTNEKYNEVMIDIELFVTRRFNDDNRDLLKFFLSRLF